MKTGSIQDPFSAELPSSALERRLNQHAARIEAAIDRYRLPLHIVFLEQLEETAGAFRDVLERLYPDATILFAVKSNPCRGALRAARRFGLGADTASEHEFRAALEEGIDPDHIVCNGNAKTDAYLRAAVESGAWIAVDNVDELNVLASIAAAAGRVAPILLRFRGMPLAGLTSADQSTAADWTKFGFDISEAEGLFLRLAEEGSVRFAGISAHIGTQIADPVGYERLLTYFLDLAEAARARGLEFRVMDIGGGYPVSFISEAEWLSFKRRLHARLRGTVGVEGAVTWNDLPMGYAGAEPAEEAPAWIGKAYWSARPGAQMLEHLLQFRLSDGRSVADRLRTLGSPKLIVEPGRSLFAPSAVTLSEVMGVKSVLGHPVVALDMGINNHGTNLITPDIFPAAVLPRRADDEPIEAFLAGRLCFSGDMISKVKVRLNRLPHRADRLALYQTGAYCADHFASNSCGFPLPGKIALDANGSIEVWRAPQRFEDVFGDIDAWHLD
jgi:diaminopimelate decarboxylase